jgi:hypothetical protein
LESGYYYFICRRKEEINIKYITMNKFLKYIGVVVLLIGVTILAIPALMGSMTNAILMTGLVVMLIGYFGHIIINKKFVN